MEMTTAAGLDIEVSTIELLDFAPVIPCEGYNHPRGLSGHDPEAPGAYMVVSPCCGPKVIQCAGRVAFMKATGDLYCGSCSANHSTDEYTFIPLDTL